ncbi:MAG: mechanosensitive ion channel family protein [Bacteroidia bacterium]|nr:mechanosensitive ion channel family protein [Bacteroidia bacterium]MDW8158132.1 mechanosensitive ion channel family protein [Bacteroidia bacterium]
MLAFDFGELLEKHARSNLFLLLTVFLILLCTWLAVRFLKYLFRKYSKIIEQFFNKDPTFFNFTKNLSIAIVYVIGIGLAIASIPAFRTFTVSLFAGAGVLAAIIGFASQQAISNVISGFFIVLFKPIRVNDIIELDSRQIGVVEEITIRHTVIRNFRNQRIVIPNAIINSTTIINYNLVDEKICRHIDFIITMDSDHNKAMQIMEQEILKHPLLIDNRTPQDIEQNIPQVQVRLIEFTSLGILLRAYAWTKNQSDAFSLHCDVNKTIKNEFDKHNIRIAHLSTEVIKIN